MKVLLIGKRARILQEAARILNSHNIDTEITDNLDLSHLKAMDIKDVSCVAFGRALTKDQKKELTNHYLQSNPQIKIIEGWAPIPELITGQILAAVQPLAGIHADGANISSSQSISVSATAYRLTWLYRIRKKASRINLSQNPVDLARKFPRYQYFVLEHAGKYCVLINDTSVPITSEK